jgi:hypothetical protein
MFDGDLFPGKRGRMQYAESGPVGVKRRVGCALYSECNPAANPFYGHCPTQIRIRPATGSGVSDCVSIGGFLYIQIVYLMRNGAPVGIAHSKVDHAQAQVVAKADIAQNAIVENSTYCACR